MARQLQWVEPIVHVGQREEDQDIWPYNRGLHLVQQGGDTLFLLVTILCTEWKFYRYIEIALMCFTLLYWFEVVTLKQKRRPLTIPGN